MTLKSTMLSITDNDTNVINYLNLDFLVSIVDDGEVVCVTDSSGKQWRFYGASYEKIKDTLKSLGYMQ